MRTTSKLAIVASLVITVLASGRPGMALVSKKPHSYAHEMEIGAISKYVDLPVPQSETSQAVPYQIKEIVIWHHGTLDLKRANDPAIDYPSLDRALKKRILEKWSGRQEGDARISTLAESNVNPFKIHEEGILLLNVNVTPMTATSTCLGDGLTLVFAPKLWWTLPEGSARFGLVGEDTLFALQAAPIVTSTANLEEGESLEQISEYLVNWLTQIYSKRDKNDGRENFLP